jgi:hypothetical protein
MGGLLLRFDAMRVSSMRAQLALLTRKVKIGSDAVTASLALASHQSAGKQFF